ncbi:MAG: MarR family winged helix-turn-helix transcriptional regulator [Gemmatimonadales bacterium]|jgi:DNA-binding MarR family transcriptional regulator
MTGKLKTEIGQGIPFPSLEAEAALNIVRTADAYLRLMAKALKPAGLTPTQYNALRILRGAGAAGHTCTAVSERMLTRDPDVTRLLDRLEKRGLVERERHPQDRRAIVVHITEAGRQLLEQLDAPMAEVPRQQLGALGAERLKDLITLLEASREGLY